MFNFLNVYNEKEKLIFYNVAFFNVAFFNKKTLFNVTFKKTFSKSKIMFFFFVKKKTRVFLMW